MRLTVFTPNQRKSYNQKETFDKRQDLNKKFDLRAQFIINYQNMNNDSSSKNHKNQEKIMKSINPIISQHLNKSHFSNLEALGVTFMKIISHQIVDNGYSSFKLNILKAFNDMEKQKIFNRYLEQFNFKTSPNELVTIFNSSVKIISKQLKNENMSEQYLRKPKTLEEQNSCYKKIHSIVVDHIKQFPVCLQFFKVFIKMVLMLVNYPKLHKSLQDSDSNEVFFIVCEYLGCRIEKNSHWYILEKIHFIKQSNSHIQFGIINFEKFNKSSKGFFKPGNSNKQNRSARSVSIIKDKSKSPFTKTSQKQSKGKALQFELKKDIFLFNNRKMTKCVSRLEINSQQSINELEKQSKELESLKSTETSNQLAKILKRSSFFCDQTSTPIYQKSSMNISMVKPKEQISYQCFKCFQRKGLSFQRNVVQVRI